MKKCLLILTVVMLLIPSLLWATAQIPDYLIYNGETHPIFTNPLESYFNESYPRPNHLFVRSCTACWRGYVATWKIDQGQLFLQKIVEGSCSDQARDINLSLLFPDQKEPIPASWFNGSLRIPQGERLLYVHMGYGSVYEKEMILTFEKGKLVKEELLDNRKRPLPSGDKKSLDELQKLKDWEESQKRRN